MKRFDDRKQAAEELAGKLKTYRNDKNAIILAIPRGALEIGAILRKRLNLPLDIVVTKKIGAPGNEEFAIGVVDPEGNVDYDEELLKRTGIPASYIQDEAKRLRHVIRRRYKDYRGKVEPPQVEGKTCLVVDDGIATGHTIQAAVHYLKRKKARKVVVAVPVAAPDSAEALKKEVHRLIILKEPAEFYAVAQFYEHFPQVSDKEAIGLLGLRAA